MNDKPSMANRHFARIYSEIPFNSVSMKCLLISNWALPYFSPFLHPSLSLTLSLSGSLPSTIFFASLPHVAYSNRMLTTNAKYNAKLFIFEITVAIVTIQYTLL